jgi:orotidine-5'-phosphate decarboxylase
MSKNIIVAVDEYHLDTFKNIIDSLDPDLCIIKVGSVSFNALGHEAVLYSANKGFDIFLDLKLHDIPNTVKKSLEGLTNLPICMITIHVSGGKQMMHYAMEAVKGTGIKVFGVSVLTSLSDEDTNLVYQRNAVDQVNAMIDLAIEANIDGVVCSPHELNLVTKKSSLLSITPGIRLKNTNDDQSRVMTPKEAISLGANYIVVGRPITASRDINKALKEIYNSLGT